MNTPSYCIIIQWMKLYYQKRYQTLTGASNIFHSSKLTSKVQNTHWICYKLQQQQKMNIDRLICNLSNVIEFSVKREILNTHSLRYMLNYRFFITIIHNTPAESTAHRRQVPDVIPAIIIINCCPCVCVCVRVFIDLLHWCVCLLFDGTWQE